MADRDHMTEVLLRATVGERAPARSPSAADELFELVYPELRRLAESFLAMERPDHTLQATELVHEAYLRLVDQTRCEWRNRAQFMAIAGRAMRRILVDWARRRASGKRGGGLQRVMLEESLELGSERADTVILALERALAKFEQEEPEKARVVEMLYFAGFTQDECARFLGISPRTVSRYWDYAQAWLYTQMSADADSA
jgi:RNA polymerase sigma factor (TIGR02999 family)